MTHRLINAFLAWVLAFGLIALLAAALLSQFGWPVRAWASASLVIAGVGVRPLENLVRRHGYKLDRVEDVTGLDAETDRVSEAAEAALADQVRSEIERP